MTKFGWQLTASNILPAENLSTIHIILNEPGDRTKVQSILRREGYTVQSFEDGEVLLKSVSLSPPDVILIGIAPPGVGSLEILSRIRHLRADSMIILLADSARGDFSYRAMRLGAHDVILEPNPPERLNTAIQNALKTKELIQETKKLKNELRLRGDFDNIAGTSPGVCLVMDDLRRLSESEIPVIFRGEAGTGKELAARALHYNSRRADDPFYTINCAVLRRESAFDDVFAPILRNSLKRDRRMDSQRLRSNGRTLFLKEIDRLEPALCGKLMEHLGPADKFHIGRFGPPLDIRIFLSVRTGAQNPADEGNPIGELMGRLDPWEVHIPPLRERGGDIEHLANFFLSGIRSETHRPDLHITREALRVLSAYAWPGNIRELKKVIRQASHTSEAPAIDVMDLVSIPYE
ncbi:MAG TPA: hypothetical protein DDZ83_10450, partial [Nitrospinae bacterium]|nr:hypothetical protein [Nitrospinota bacterium]